MDPEGRPPIELDLPQARPRAAAPAPAAWRPPDPPETSWLQDNLGRVIVGGVLAAAVLGGWLWWHRPVQIPDLALKDSAGEAATLSGLRQDKPRLLVVFLMKGDTLSAYVLNALKDVHASKASGMAFVGLVIGSQADAEAYRVETGAPFPMYGLRDLQDPFQLRELFRKVGVSNIAMTGVYGGTVVVVDRRNEVVLRLEKDGVQDLGKRLARF